VSVLLVDDEASLREPLAKRLRKKHGYLVETAATAEEAAVRVEEAQGHYDVALIDDLLMPSANQEPKPMGLQLMTEIKADYPNIEFILFTGWGIDSGLEALRAGAYRYLEKPLRLEELGVMIELAAEHRRLREAQREKQTLEQLMKTSTALLSGQDLEDMLEKILGAVQAVGFDRVRMYLLSEDRGSMIGCAQAGMETEFVGMEIPTETDPYMRAVLDYPHPQIFERTQEGPLPYEQELAKEEVDEWACVPLTVREEVIGKLSVDNKFSQQPVSKGDLMLVSLFASQAAAAIENARLRREEHEATQEAKERARNLDTLQSLALTVGSSLDLDKTLGAACRAAVEFFQVDHSGLVLFGPDQATGEVRAEYPKLGTTGKTIPVTGVPAEERLLQTAKPLVIHDVAEQESLGPVRDVLQDSDIRSVLIVPVVDKNGEVVGSFSLDAIGDSRRFTQEEVDLCKVFAAHVAVAIENARLFAQLNETKEWRDALVENAFDAVVAINQDKKITIFNQQAEEMLGWPAEEAIGRNPAELYADVARAREVFDTITSEGRVAGWSVNLQHRCGSEIPSLLSAKLVRDAEGSPLGQAGFIRDLRDVRLLEDQLRALIKGNQAVTGTLELNQVLDLIIESAVDVFPTAQAGTIHLYDESDDLLRPEATTYSFSDGVLEALSFALGEGVAGWVCQNAETAIVKDARSDPRYTPVSHTEIPAHRSIICLPLQARGHVIGTLSLDNLDTCDAFQVEDAGLLHSFADQAAIAIENARRMRQLDQMHRAARSISRAFEPGQTLQQIVDSALDVFRADLALLWAYDEPHSQFPAEGFSAAGVAIDALERLRTSEPRCRLIAHMVMRRGYVAVEDISQSEYDFLGGSVRDLLDRGDVKSFQGIALEVGDEGLGVLCLGYDRVRTFDENEEAALGMFAGHAGLALKNARLLKQVSAARDTTKVTAEMMVLEDLSRTLCSVVDGVETIVKCDTVTLYAYDASRDRFVYPPTTLGLRDEDAVKWLDRVDRDSVVWKVLNLDQPYVAPDAPNDPLMTPQSKGRELEQEPFVIRENIKSSAGFPLTVGGRKVGVMFVSFRSHHPFTQDEIDNVKLLAHQAAVGIRNAQLYAETVRKANALESLYEAGKAVTGTLALDQILSRIVEQAWSLAEPRGDKTHFSHLALALARGQRLQFVAGHPPGLMPLRYDIDLETDTPIGIAGRVVTSGESQLVGDVLTDPDYIETDPRVLSQLSVPIQMGDRVTGVISVEHHDHNAFDEEDQLVLEALAAQAAIAIENARHFEDLKEIKGYVGSKTAVDWMRMVSTAWGHNVRREVSTGLAHLKLLRMGSSAAEPAEALSKELDGLEAVFERIKRTPITAPLSYEDTASSVEVNSLLRLHFERQWTHPRYKSIDLSMELDDRPEGMPTVRVSPEWLRRAIEILVDNSVHAMNQADSPQKGLAVVTRLTGESVEITIRDTGPGFPDDVLPKIFKQPIEKEVGSRGAGIGLMLAKTIVGTYGGSIRVASSGPEGATVAISLPLEPRS
jgi:PAS domain S-box-containing protein